MDYQGNIIRPPSEADSIILQITIGCSHNKCTFCGAYKDKLFSIKPDDIIADDLDFAAKYCKRQKRVFIADGDALILPHRKLVSLLRQIKEKLPWVTKISLYGNGKSIRRKTVEELIELRLLGLKRIYTGLESGDNKVLADIKKGETADSMIQAGSIVFDSGIFLSVTVLLGIAGTNRYREHALHTAEVLNKMKPKQIAALTLMVLNNTPLGEQVKSGDFSLASPEQILTELRILVENLTLEKVQIHANHASNYLPIAGRLQRDKQSILSNINKAMSGNTVLVPEVMRRL